MPGFDLRLTPPPPLRAQSALRVVAVTGLVMLLAAARFVVLGAWPVLPFMAADLAVLVWALRVSARAARAYETLRLDECGLVVRKVAASGKSRSYRLEPVLTRAELEQLPTAENRLWLVCRGTRLGIGRFLSPRERGEVYAVIARGLAA